MSLTSPRIIIIGAGAAGIAAATRLLENGLHNVTVLEAENRIGGRVHSVEFGGSVVDLGAQWCHGEEGNVVYQTVKDLNLLRSSRHSYSDFTYYLSNGKLLDKAITNRLVAIADDVFEDEAAPKGTEGTFGDYFMKEYKNRVTEAFPGDVDVQNTADLLLEWFHKLFLCLDAASSWFEMSATGPYQYQKCEGDLYLHWRNRGYRTILDVLMKKVPDVTQQLPMDDKIFLNKEVNRVVWDLDSRRGDGVMVHCSDGSFYSGDHVITTVSLGVLKKLYKNFVPDLPRLKQTAIEAMAIGSIQKILLKFPERWWPEDLTGFSFVWTEADRSKISEEFPTGPSRDGRSWLEDIFGFYVIDSHPRVLLGWVVGPMVEEIETLPEDVVIEGSLYLLKKFVGNKYSITQPDGLLRSNWKTNPHFGGAYTYLCSKAEQLSVSHADLASPVVNRANDPVLLFAGEGTHSKYFSTVHGAVETGFREADRILNMYKSPRLIHRKVVIVGAGMAGLGAATALHRLGCNDFLLVEAQNRPGGRVRTLRLDGDVLELGAQWIHGRDNPLYELASHHHLVSETTSEEGLGLYLRDNGEPIDGDIVKRVDFEVGRILSECEKFVGAQSHPGSVGEFLKGRFSEFLDRCGDSDDVREIKLELLDWHVRFQVIDNSCMNLSRLSAKGWGQYVCMEDTAHVNLKGGYDELVAILVDDLPKNSLLLDTPVARIRRATKSSEKNELVCQDGSMITCDHLILTPSLGVLKGFLKITPPLPSHLVQSIRDWGFHGIGKIFLVFERKWWDCDGFQFVWRRNVAEDDSCWTKHITGFDPVVHAPKVLLGWVGGEGVEVMEGLSDEDVGTHCVKLLRRFIRDRAVPEPVRVVRTRWLSNPWIRGGYSHITPDCEGSACGMQKLSEPVFVDDKPRVLLAGEAVHPSHYSTTHGAFESGQQQARVLFQHMKKNSKL